ncbi:NAD-dependent epimerase/dehydratase family protein [Chloroflexota bacterium]
MTKLITGGTGYIGAELAQMLVERGEKVVLFDIVINRHRITDIESEVKIIQGDLSNYSQVHNSVKDNNVTEIYHLGAIMTNVSEVNPWGSFQTNVIGTYNVFEAARLLGVNRMMFTSTLGTYGLLLDEVLTDTSIQRPVTVYGCGKLYCEGLGRFYHKKFGLDFRSIRYAYMIGPNVRTPGHWAPPMIEDAILGKQNECIYARPETAVSMIYVRDAARAADMVLQAPAESIKMMNYNVTGIPRVISAGELEAALKKRYPGAMVNYQPESSLWEIGNDYSVVKKFDDSYARNEWDWKPEYDSPEAIITVFEKDMKSHPERYGLAGH